MTRVKSEQRVADHGEVFTPAWMIDGAPITVAEWGYLDEDKFQRLDFHFDTLTHSSA